MQFSLLLSSTLDIFEARSPQTSVDQEFGLLQAVDESLACYGWMTNTGVKLVIVVDMAGSPAQTEGGAVEAAQVGIRDADLRPVSLQMICHPI